MLKKKSKVLSAIMYVKRRNSLADSSEPSDRKKEESNWKRERERVGAAAEAQVGNKRRMKLLAGATYNYIEPEASTSNCSTLTSHEQSQPLQFLFIFFLLNFNLRSTRAEGKNCDGS